MPLPDSSPPPAQGDEAPPPPTGLEFPGGIPLPPLVRRSLLFALAGVLTIVLAFLFLGFATNIPWSSTASLQAPVFFLGAVVVWTLGSPLLQAWRLRYLLVIRSSRPPFPFLVQLHFAERFLAAFLPFRLALPVKALLLQRRGGVEMGTGLSITVLDALFEAGVTITIAVVGAPLLIRTSVYLFGLVVLGLAVAFFLVTPERLKSWGGRLRVGTRLSNSVRFLYDLRLQTGALLRDVRLLGLLPFLAGAQLLLLVTGDFVLRSVGNPLPWGALLFILNASALLGNATTIPSGWGARELTSTALLITAGVPPGSALLVSVMLRVATLPPIAIGYVFAVRIGWKGIAQKPS